MAPVGSVRQGLKTITRGSLHRGRIPLSSVKSRPTEAVTPDASKHNIAAVANLEPQSLWNHFSALSLIPRPSKGEQMAVDYVRAVAKAAKLQVKSDSVGNIVVTRPRGDKAHDGCPTVIVQSHLDMVGEKGTDAKNHDFDTDPVVLQAPNAQGWMKATGTTLGADNGIGVAASLSVLTEPCETWPCIKALFTVDEEAGMGGAMGLDSEALSLSGNIMLNLDTEEWPALYCGSAGGADSIIRFPVGLTHTKDGHFVRLTLSGLTGGHSGVDIDQGRGNAIRLLARIATGIREASTDAHLVSISGGDKRNAIPREAYCVMHVSSPQKAYVTGEIALAEIIQEFAPLESNMRLRVDWDVARSNSLVMTQKSTEAVLTLLNSLPNGVLAQSNSIPGVVGTSTNLASVCPVLKSEGDSAALEIVLSVRSFHESAIRAVQREIKRLAASLSPTNRTDIVTESDGYPGWQPDPDNSRVLALAQRVLSDLVPTADVSPKAIHAGLECGVLAKRIGRDLDIISFGPTIHGAHSPDERVDVSTVAPFFHLLKGILSEIGKGKY